MNSEAPFSRLTSDEKRALLRIARCSLEMLDATREEREAFLQTLEKTPGMQRKAGVFVSLHARSDGRLRGCIGWMDGRETLATAVFENARAAALRDHRFPPVEVEEVLGLEIEISVLSPMCRVEDPAEIEVGRDGLFIRSGTHRGVLLPQVATLMRWQREEFLDGVCRKAGLQPGDWKQDVDLQRFEAEVFSESDFQVGEGIENPG